jgi:hypothetical protein
LPNSIEVPGAPSTPACAIGVPGGLEVTSGGDVSRFEDQSRYSAPIQNGLGGGGAGALRSGLGLRSAAAAGASEAAIRPTVASRRIGRTAASPYAFRQY